MLGVLCYQSGRSAAAVELIGRALAANPTFPQACFNLGIALKSLGRLDEAAAAYQRAIGLKPDYAEAHDNLGNILKELGRDEEAAAAYRQALAVNPASAITHNNLGIALKSLGRLDEAITSYQHAFTLNPAYAEAHGNLGNALRDLGRSDDALASYTRALHINPEFADVHYGLGSLLQDQGRVEEALPCIERAVALKPDFADACFALGRLYTKLGRLQDAAASYQRVAALRPDYPDVHYLLGCILTEQGQAQEAAASYRREIANHPGHVGAHSDLGTALLDMEQWEAAAACFRRAIELKSDFAAAHYNLGLALAGRGRLEEAAASYRQALALRQDYTTYNNLGNVLSEQGWLGEAADNYRQACALRPEATEAHSNLLFCLHYAGGLEDAGLYAEHLEFNAQHARALGAEIQPHRNDRDPARPLRIGYVSADFKQHPVGYFFEPVLAAHDRAQYEIYCYSSLAKPDQVSGRLQAQCKVWRDVVEQDDATLARMIREDAIDILVDLSGHTGGNRLLTFARKPAPVQATWLGYFNTTGLDTMDYAIWDRATLPPAAERWFTEKIIRMPDSRFCYRPPDYAPPVAALPAAARGHVTFGCFNNLSKVTPEVLALWARVLQAVPQGRLLLKWKSLGDDTVRERYLTLFADHGIGAERLDLRGASPHQQMLTEYGDVDIALDPFPYSGGLTSCEALWMGVPLVTLAGARPLSRQTLGYLSVLDLQELAASSEDQYVQIAADLARDLGRLALLRASLRDSMAASPLCDGPRFARNLEQRYRAMWEEWCASPDAVQQPDER